MVKLSSSSKYSNSQNASLVIISASLHSVMYNVINRGDDKIVTRYVDLFDREIGKQSKIILVNCSIYFIYFNRLINCIKSKKYMHLLFLLICI